MKHDNILSPSQNALKTYALTFVLFFLLSCAVIGKALFIDNCFAYDTNDDINHSFTGLYMAKQLLQDGAMPFFNYYNNFGTPLMGDALTYPLALQAIPYYLADIEQYPLVATINKFVLCFLTLTVLLIYYRMYSFSVFTSTVTAICVFFNFPHFWFFAHHHYQATLVFAVAIFIAQKSAVDRNDKRLPAVAVAVLFGLMIYSVSANLILLCTPFFVLHPFFLRATRKAMAVNLLALFAGGMIGGVQIVATAAAAINSARVGESFSEGSAFQLSWSQLMLKLLYYAQSTGVRFCHINVVTYFPMILIMAYCAGIYLLYRRGKTIQLSTSVALGLVPALPVCVMLVHTGLWDALPILKSTDITRILWVTMVFAGIGVGCFIEAACKKTVDNRLILGMLAVQAVATMFAVQMYMNERSDSTVLLGYFSALLLLSVIAFRNRGASAGGNSDSLSVSRVASALLLVTILFTYSPIVYFVGGWDDPKRCTSMNYFSDKFNIEKIRRTAERIHPSGRFALDVFSGRGLELQMEVFGRHGGGGRSIMVDSTLHGVLTSRNMIENDDRFNVYHFNNPWDVSTANRLGLRYFGARSQEQRENWQFVEKWGFYYVYENMHKPTLVSLRDKADKSISIDGFEITGNDMLIKLPQSIDGGRLSVAMTARPGFSVEIDGSRREFDVDEFGFFNIDVSSGDDTVKLSYNPLNLKWLL